jgi:hypothetical protein
MRQSTPVGGVPSSVLKKLQKICLGPLDLILETRKTEVGRSALCGRRNQSTNQPTNNRTMKAETNMTNPILILEQIPGCDTVEEPNVYGYSTIRIWLFNYDGKGGALVTYENEAELNLCFGEDLQYILLGNPESGHRWYRPTNLNVPEPKRPTMF